MGNVTTEFEQCVAQGKIKAFADGPKLIAKELRAASEDLETAQASLREGRAKWSTVQAYYVMFHAARALLFAKGFRERHHRCLRIAILHLYANQGDSFVRFVEDFELAKRLREDADYEGEFSLLSAQKLVKKAEQFLQLAKEILGDKKTKTAARGSLCPPLQKLRQWS